MNGEFLTNLSNYVQNFVENILGKSGAAAAGWTVIAVAIVGLIISLVQHATNQQARIPKWWFWCILGGFGASILGGIGWIVIIFKQIGETIKGIFGV